KAAHYRLVLGRCYWEAGDPAAARRGDFSVRDTPEPLGPSQDPAPAHIRLPRPPPFPFEGVEAPAEADTAGRVATPAGADEARILAYASLGAALAYLGEVSEGIRYLDRSYREGAALGFDWVALSAVHNGCLLRIWNLRVDECPPLLAEMKRLRG